MRKKSIRKKRSTHKKYNHKRRSNHKKYSRKKRSNHKKQSIRKQKTFKKKSPSIIRFESDYQNLRLRYLRAKKIYSNEEKKELSYLESLLKSLQKK